MAPPSNAGKELLEVIGPEVSVAMPRSEVWQLLADLSLAHHYVPGLTGTEITSEQQQGLGASRQVFSKRPPMDETVVEWQEGEGFLLRLHYGPQHAWGPFAEAFFRYGIKDGAIQHTTLLQNAMLFRLKGGAVGAALGNLLMRKVFKSTLAKVTQAQAAFYGAQHGK